MQKPSIPGLLTVIFGLIILIVPLSAATVTISPEVISENVPTTVSIADLHDNSTFMIRIEASVPLDTNERFSLSTNNLQIPFALKGGQIEIHAENVETANFSVHMGSRTVMLSEDGENGVVNIKQGTDIPEGTINYITLDGKGVAGANTVTTSMDLSGKKVGPDNADVTFTISGLNGGTVDVKVYVDGDLVPTTSTTTTTTTTSTGGSSSGGDSDSTVTTTTTETTTRTVSSLDGDALLTYDEGSLSGAETDDLTIMESNRAVPENWNEITGPYAILPSTATFNPHATITLALNKTGIDKNESLTILAYTDGSWKPLPSRINGSTISADISEAGEFALVTPHVTVSTTSIPSETNTLTTTTDTTAAPSQSAATTAPTQSSLPVWCALGALAVALMTGKMRK